MADMNSPPPQPRGKGAKCSGCPFYYKWNGKLFERHTIHCPGSNQPPTEQIMDQVEGTCSECGLTAGLVLMPGPDDARQYIVIDHSINVGDCCNSPSNEPEKMTCLVCNKQYVLREDGKCRYHCIAASDCGGSKLKPSPDYTTPGEGENKFGACSVCELPLKLKSSRDGLFLVEKHSAPKIQCKGSGLTTEEMRIVMEVKETNLDPADVDGLETNMGNLDSRLE